MSKGLRAGTHMYSTNTETNHCMHSLPSAHVGVEQCPFASCAAHRFLGTSELT